MEKTGSAIKSMSEQIIGLPHWLQTPPGQCLLQWQAAHVDAAVTDVFGYHALQLGLPAWHALRTNRMPQRWLAAQPESEHLPAGAMAVHLWTEFHALPFAPASVDLVVLPLEPGAKR